jgi:beta-galactosidase
MPVMDETILGGAESVDIAGYNYMQYRYGEDKVKYPDRIIVGSETYPKDIPSMWDYIKNNHNVIGDFTWTAWDYLGETGIGLVSYTPREYHQGFYALYPCISGYCGDFDLAGSRLPQSYWREIVYGLRSDPYIAVHNPAMLGKEEYLSTWGWDDVISSWAYSVKEGTMLSVDVYGNGEAELFLNGKSLGKKDCGENRKATFSVPYEKGELKAVCGGSFTLLSGGGKKKLTISSEKIGNIVFADISIADEEGTLLPECDVCVSLDVKNGSLLGFGSGVPLTEESYCDNVHTTYRGRALAIIEADGETEITASVNGFNSVRITR